MHRAALGRDVGAGTGGRLAAEAVAAGMSTGRVKVGNGPLADDAGRVAAVRAALGPGGRIRIGANGAWDVEAAVAAIDRLAGFDLELVEQPVADLGDLARVRRRGAGPGAPRASPPRPGECPRP